MELQEIIKKPPREFLILFGTLALFLICNALLRDNPSLNFIPTIIAALVVAEIAFFVAAEVREGAEEHGWKHEALDTLIALGVAIAIWYGVSFLLNTSAPLSGVVSCSMLPNLQRGDFVVVQGSVPKAYEITMSQSELDSLNSRAQVTYNGKNASLDGSVFAYCRLNRESELCKVFLESPEDITERKGAFTYKYAKCPISFSNGASGYQPCLSEINFKGRQYLTNFSNDIIVYQPPAGDLYSLVGDIVHRAVFRISAEGKTYYLTRGDNNPVLDLQIYDYGQGLANHPIPAENVRGKVIGRIPWLGYFKLFISGYLQEDDQCKTQLEFPHVD